MILSSQTLTGVTTKQSLIEDIDFLVGTDSNSYPLADKLRNINSHYGDVVALILEANDRWEWDDANRTDFPIGTCNLVANQQDYDLTGLSGLLKILRVEVADSSGTFSKLQPVDETQIGTAMSQFQSTAGTPQFYRETSNSVELYPKPSYNSVNGLKIYYQRSMSEFTTTSASSVPGFALPFHRILSLGASYDYAMANGKGNANQLFQRMELQKENLKNYYANRNKDVRPMLKPRVSNYE
jgi:hypothetical protein